MILGICGFATVGKDAVADIIVQEFGATKVSWADPLRRDIWTLNPIVAFEEREIESWTEDGWRYDTTIHLVTYREAIERYGYNEAKARYPELRRLLQVYGTDVHRVIDPDYWVNRTMASLDPDKLYVVPDVRFPNEAAVCHQLILVSRPGIGSINGHASDAGLAFPYATASIDNDGTLGDLAAKVVPVVGGWIG